ncbi:hypothetical protein U1Q18_001953 [Sarracenia purpurea var. burkii]
MMKMMGAMAMKPLDSDLSDQPFTRDQGGCNVVGEGFDGMEQAGGWGKKGGSGSGKKGCRCKVEGFEDEDGDSFGPSGIKAFLSLARGFGLLPQAMANMGRTITSRTVVIYEDDQYYELVNPPTAEHQSSSQAAAEVDLELRLGNSRYNGSSSSRGPTNNGIEELAEDSGHKQPAVDREIKLSCAICLDTLKEEACTKCGHVFCRPCITMAAVTQGRCPTCRRQIHYRGIRPIHLPQVKLQSPNSTLRLG